MLFQSLKLRPSDRSDGWIPSFPPIDFGDRPDGDDDDGEENCPNFGSSILFLALTAQRPL